MYLDIVKFFQETCNRLVGITSIKILCNQLVSINIFLLSFFHVCLLTTLIAKVCRQKVLHSTRRAEQFRQVKEPRGQEIRQSIDWQPFCSRCWCTVRGLGTRIRAHVFEIFNLQQLFYLQQLFLFAATIFIFKMQQLF